MKYLELNPDKLEQALKQSRTGQKSDTAFLGTELPTQHDVAELVQLAESLRSLPKNEFTRPIKSYRFAEVSKQPTFLFWSTITSNLRLAVIPLGLVMILSGGGLIAQATENSLPGDKLYTLKRAGEEARLSLTLSEEKVAFLNIEYAQKRLEEVKKVIDSGKTENKAVAIEALKEQTEKAVAEVSKISLSESNTENDTALVQSLVAINNDQKEVLTNLSNQPESTEATTVALNSTKENEITLARIISTTKEEPTQPEEITITGVVTSFNDTALIIGDTTFGISPETLYYNPLGELIAATPASLAGEIKVTGIKTETSLTATKIQILVAPEVTPSPIETKPVVKGIITTKPSTPTITPKPIVVPTEPQPEPIPQENQAVGGFIVEPSERQYTE